MANNVEQDLDVLEDAMMQLHRAMSRHRLWEHITASANVSIDRTSAIILKVISSDNKAHCRLSELADKLGVEAPSVTRKVQQLEAAGLVKRRPDKEDRRATRLYATTSGRSVVRKLHKARRKNLANALSKWPAQDRQQLASLLNRLANEMANQHYQSISLK